MSTYELTIYHDLIYQLGMKMLEVAVERAQSGRKMGRDWAVVVGCLGKVSCSDRSCPSDALGCDRVDLLSWQSLVVEVLRMVLAILWFRPRRLPSQILCWPQCRSAAWAIPICPGCCRHCQQQSVMVSGRWRCRRRDHALDNMLSIRL